jgi:hypothetical protein
MPKRTKPKTKTPHTLLFILFLPLLRNVLAHNLTNVFYHHVIASCDKDVVIQRRKLSSASLTAYASVARESTVDVASVADNHKPRLTSSGAPDTYFLHGEQSHGVYRGLGKSQFLVARGQVVEYWCRLLLARLPSRPPV